MHKNILLIAFILLLHSYHAQTKQDTLRGSITPERSWWNVKKYDLHITPSISKQKITGKNTITFYTARHGKRMQIDLQ